MMEEGKKHNNPFWIGLLMDRVEWADGGQSAYRNWLSNEQSDEKDLVFMDNSGKWQRPQGNKGDYYPLCCSKTTKHF